MPEATKSHPPLHLIKGQKPTPDAPRLFRLGDLLGEWETDANPARAIANRRIERAAQE